MTASVEKLQKARELIARPGGWGQGFSHKRPNTCCAGEALDEVYAFSSEKRLLCSAAGTCPQDVSSIVAWNDAPGRTQEEVVAAFDKAIELAKAQEASS